MDKRQKDRRSVLIKIISIILIIPPLFSSCLKEEADNRQLLPERTILFYMAGDNGLSEETQEKVDALVSAWNIADENRLLVFQDRGGENAPPAAGNQSRLQRQGHDRIAGRVQRRKFRNYQSLCPRAQRYGSLLSQFRLWAGAVFP